MINNGIQNNNSGNTTTGGSTDVNHDFIGVINNNKIK